MPSLSPHLPFNCESLAGRFVPAGSGTEPSTREGCWIVIRDQALLLQAGEAERDSPAAPAWRLPQSPLPEGLAARLDPVVYLGTYLEQPCWAAGLAPEAAVPRGLHAESLLPAKTRLRDDQLSLAGLAHQALHWEGTSRHCPRCGAATARLSGEWGKHCPQCQFDHYPHLHPAIIVLVRDGERVLLTRKSVWPPRRYSLVAGFVDIGESLEGAVHREVAEEVGVRVRDIRYVGSQYWPFPSQIMVGFTAQYAGGELRVNRSELEDARWFSVRELPDLPPRVSIARFILDHYAIPADPTSTAGEVEPSP
jgi:NAD+ diphosphatase